MALLSLLMRAAYIYATDFPALDPWRHAALIKNILDGKGFTLFAGSPYIWYSPLWYYPAAWLGKLLGFGALELVVSSLPPILLYLLLWRSTRELRPALAAGLGTALFGPLLLYSTGLGSDGAALDLLLLALLLPEYRCGKLAYLLAGLLFGLACGMRANFIFAGLAFCRPRDWRNLPYFIIGAALPLGFVLWRNYDITSTQAFVFTWDALASRGASFNLLSAFLPGLNPEVGAANEILNQSTYLFQLYPQAFSDHAVERGLWVFSGCLAALACKDARPKLAVIGFALMFAATGFSRSVYPLRQWLGLFPFIFWGLARTCRDFKILREHPYSAWFLAAFCLVCGADALAPAKMPPAEAYQPPPGFLTQERYMVFSNCYLPEVLLAANPDKKFIGLPWRAKDMPDFEAAYPDYEYALWHNCELQDEIWNYLADKQKNGDYLELKSGRNNYGLVFKVLKRTKTP